MAAVPAPTPARTSTDQTDPMKAWTVQQIQFSHSAYTRPINPAQDNTANVFRPQDIPLLLPPHVRYRVYSGNDVVVGRVND